jgi:hypothetical protein
MWPVARVGKTGPGTVRGCRPRGPEEEGSQLAEFFGMTTLPSAATT